MTKLRPYDPSTVRNVVDTKTNEYVGVYHASFGYLPDNETKYKKRLPVGCKIEHLECIRASADDVSRETTYSI